MPTQKEDHPGSRRCLNSVMIYKNALKRQRQHFVVA